MSGRAHVGESSFSLAFFEWCLVLARVCLVYLASMADSKQEKAPEVKAHRGIPAATFIENLGGACASAGGPEELLKTMHNLYGSVCMLNCAGPALLVSVTNQMTTVHAHALCRLSHWVVCPVSRGIVCIGNTNLWKTAYCSRRRGC
jgi:hypothetical protein